MVHVANQLIIHKPNFLIFNYCPLDLKEIREILYETYELLADGTISEMNDFKDNSMPIDEVYDRIISDLAFDDEDQWEWMQDDECDVFDSQYTQHGWKITHDLEEILLLDHVCFFDGAHILRNPPIVKVW